MTVHIFIKSKQLIDFKFQLIDAVFLTTYDALICIVIFPTYFFQSYLIPFLEFLINRTVQSFTLYHLSNYPKSLIL